MWCTTFNIDYHVEVDGHYYSVPHALARRPLVEQRPGERLDQAVDALGGLQQDRPAVGTGLLLVELGDSGLSNRFGNRTVCGTVSVVTQVPGRGTSSRSRTRRAIDSDRSTVEPASTCCVGVDW